MRGWRRGLACVVLAIATLAARPASALDPAKAIPQYIARTWGAADGLPQSSVATIVQTRDGYVWFGTEEGIVRFDGVRFTVFDGRSVPALRNNTVTNLYEDVDGRLWIGTFGGGALTFANGVFAVAHGVADDAIVTGFAPDPRGGVLASIAGGHLLRSQNGGPLVPLDHPPLGDVRDMVAAADGRIWTASAADGVSVYDPRTNEAHRYGASDGIGFVEAVHADRSGAVWIGTHLGLARFADGAFTWFTKADGLTSDVVRAIYEDRDGSIWIGTEGGGVDRRTADGVFSSLRRADGLPADNVLSFVEDREGDLFVGTQDGGLVRLSEGVVTTYSTEHGLSDAGVWSVLEDRTGALWVGTDTGGLDVLPAGATFGELRLGKFQVIGESDGLPASTVLSLHEARDGSIWIGTSGGGVAHRVAGKLVSYDVADGLAGNVIRSVSESSDGAIWIGAYGGGVSKLVVSPGSEDARITNWTTRDGLQSNLVLAVEEQGNGEWVATSGGGLARIEGDKVVRVYRTADGLSSDLVKPLLVDGDTLWIGTLGGGLGRLKNGVFTHVDGKQGLFSDVVFAIARDGLGHLWMTCNRGIFRIDEAAYDDVVSGRAASLVSTSYGLLEGMKSAECDGGTPGAFRAHDGVMWFPTIAGVVAIDPRERSHVNDVPPPIVVERIVIDRRPVAPTASLGRLDASVKDFEFGWTGLSFRAPERVRFRYRLDGFDKEWIDAADRRVAFYTNLPPGKYRFHVIGCNADGVWNEVGAAVEFDVAPHFYQTWPFRAGVALLGLALVLGGMRLRLRQLRARSRFLEARVKERTAQLAKALVSLEEKDALIDEDLQKARAFQQGILPVLPRSEHVRFAAVYRPASLVGGDIYDVFERAPGAFRLFLADTTGHGVQASLRTMILKTEYDRLKDESPDPASLLGALNRAIYARYPGLELRCSACCLDVIVGEGGTKIVYANAAHPPLLKVRSRSRGEVPVVGHDEVYLRGAFLAMVDEVSFESTTLVLGPGERLVAFTDGLYEQEDEKGTELGVERVAAWLGEEGSIEEALARVVEGAARWAGPRGLADDVTIVAIETP